MSHLKEKIFSYRTLKMDLQTKYWISCNDCQNRNLHQFDILKINKNHQYQREEIQNIITTKKINKSLGKSIKIITRNHQKSVKQENLCETCKNCYINISNNQNLEKYHQNLWKSFTTRKKNHQETATKYKTQSKIILFLDSDDKVNINHQ